MVSKCKNEVNRWILSSCLRITEVTYAYLLRIRSVLTGWVEFIVWWLFCCKNPTSLFKCKKSSNSEFDPHSRNWRVLQIDQCRELTHTRNWPNELVHETSRHQWWWGPNISVKCKKFTMQQSWPHSECAVILLHGPIHCMGQFAACGQIYCVLKFEHLGIGVGTPPPLVPIHCMDQYAALVNMAKFALCKLWCQICYAITGWLIVLFLCAPTE